MNSATRKIPVSGARITAVKTPHMPTITKFCSCRSMIPVKLTARAKAKPVNAPMNIDGAKMPPSPPEPTVSTEVTTLTKIAAPSSSTAAVTPGSSASSGDCETIGLKLPLKISAIAQYP